MSNTDSTSKGSSIDLLASMKKGLSGAVTSGVQSVAVAGAKWAIGKGLNAAFGWESSETKKQNWVKETLEGITEELTVISEDLTTIKTQLDDLLRISETNDFLAEYNRNVDIYEGYKNVVQVVWKDFTILVKNLNDPAVQVENIDEKIAEIVSRKTDLKDSINGLESTMYSIGKEGKRNLFQSWTDACIKQLQFNQGDLLTKYMTLEAKLKYYLIWLNAGYILQVNIENYQEDLEENESTASANYYRDFITPGMSKIMENWLQCVERLVISSYAPDPNPALIDKHPTKLGPKEDIRTIFERANLIHWLTLSFSAREPYPGLLSTLLTRPSLLVNGSGKEQTPAPGFSPSTGELIPIDGAYNGSGRHMETWFKCLDFVDGGDSSRSSFLVRSFEESNIRTVRYHWSLEEGSLKAGDMINDNSGSPFDNQKLQYYSKDTLLPMAEKEVQFDDENQIAINAVLMGAGADAESLRVNLLMDYKQANRNHGWFLDYSGMKLKAGESNSYFKELSVHDRFSSKTPYYGEVKTKLKDQSHSEEHDFYAFVRFNMNYPQAHEGQSLYMVMDTAYSCVYQQLQSKPDAEKAAKAHFDFYFKLQYPEESFHSSQKRPKDYSKKIAEHITKDKDNEPCIPKESKQLVCYPNSQMHFQWRMRFHIEKKMEDTAGDVGSSKWVKRQMNAKWNINDFRLVWPVPTMNLN